MFIYLLLVPCCEEWGEQKTQPSEEGRRNIPGKGDIMIKGIERETA